VNLLKPDRVGRSLSGGHPEVRLKLCIAVSDLFYDEVGMDESDGDEVPRELETLQMFSQTPKL
jgi:hypothetical protein